MIHAGPAVAMKVHSRGSTGSLSRAFAQLRNAVIHAKLSAMLRVCFLLCGASLAAQQSPEGRRRRGAVVRPRWCRPVPGGAADPRFSAHGARPHFAGHPACRGRHRGSRRFPAGFWQVRRPGGLRRSENAYRPDGRISQAAKGAVRRSEADGRLRLLTRRHGGFVACG